MVFLRRVLVVGFDEFSRIAARVLSVVFIQVKSILDAIRANLTEFKLCSEETVRLQRTCGMGIAMAPFYPGRAGLPENIKALFRSVPCLCAAPTSRSFAK